MQPIEHATRTGCIVGDAIVVLDRKASRYFLIRRPPECPRAVDAPGRRSILSWGDGDALEPGTARRQMVALAPHAYDAADQRSHLPSLAALWWLEQRYAAKLRYGLRVGLDALSRVPAADANPDAIRRLVGSSWHARRLWSSRDRCLPRSLALTHALRVAGSEAMLVLGVALHPFAAHAWVQEHDRVINDTPDHVALFTPILLA